MKSKDKNGTPDPNRSSALYMRKKNTVSAHSNIGFESFHELHFPRVTLRAGSLLVEHIEHTARREARADFEPVNAYYYHNGH